VFGCALRRASAPQETWVVHTYGVIDAPGRFWKDLSTAESQFSAATDRGQDTSLRRATAVGKLRADIETCGRHHRQFAASKNRVGRLQSTIEERVATLEQGITAYQGWFAGAVAVNPERRGANADDRGARALIGDILGGGDRLLDETPAATRQSESLLSSPQSRSSAACSLRFSRQWSPFCSINGIGNLRASEGGAGGRRRTMLPGDAQFHSRWCRASTPRNLTALQHQIFSQLRFSRHNSRARACRFALPREWTAKRGAAVARDILRPLDDGEGMPHATGDAQGAHLECYSNRNAWRRMAGRAST